MLEFKLLFAFKNNFNIPFIAGNKDNKAYFILESQTLNPALNGVCVSDMKNEISSEMKIL